MAQGFLRSLLLLRLDELSRLQDGWEGEDSLAPTQQTVEHAKHLLASLPTEAHDLIHDVKDDFYAESDGSIVLDWALPTEQVVVTLVVRNSGISGYWFDRSNRYKTIVLTTKPSEALEPLEEIFKAVKNYGAAYFVDGNQ